MTQDQPRRLGCSIRRALTGRCPNCGKGQLFRSYLKQVESCAVCGEGWREIRADDGPIWLTVLLISLTITPVTLILVSREILPDGLSLLVVLSAALTLIYLLLPRAKGLFIAVLWSWRSD